MAWSMGGVYRGRESAHTTHQGYGEGAYEVAGYFWVVGGRRTHAAHPVAERHNQISDCPAGLVLGSTHARCELNWQGQDVGNYLPRLPDQDSGP